MFGLFGIVIWVVYYLGWIGVFWEFGDLDFGFGFWVDILDFVACDSSCGLHLVIL